MRETRGIIYYSRLPNMKPDIYFPIILGRVICEIIMYYILRIIYNEFKVKVKKGEYKYKKEKP